MDDYKDAYKKPELYSCEAYGNTFQVKDSLKKLGFRFNKDSKSWTAGPMTEREKETFQTMTLWGGVKLRFTKYGENNAKV